MSLIKARIVIHIMPLPVPIQSIVTKSSFYFCFPCYILSEFELSLIVLLD